MRMHDVGLRRRQVQSTHLLHMEHVRRVMRPEVVCTIREKPRRFIAIATLLLLDYRSHSYLLLKPLLWCK